ncbi:MAG: cyclic nucleotide-binding domain-containing protein [Bdellovibrionales bacterium]|nr:cyclic nucleotide-binding domain-containing protein [Bdellovibrionales bacterium]
MTKVPSNIIKDLDEIVSARLYRNNADIIYKGHIPHCGFLLLKGEITLTISKTEKIILDSGSLIGVRELMQSDPIGFDVKISSNSSVLILDRSTVDEILKSDNEGLKELFCKEVA